MLVLAIVEPDTEAPDTGAPDIGAPDTVASDTGGLDTGELGKRERRIEASCMIYKEPARRFQNLVW